MIKLTYPGTCPLNVKEGVVAIGNFDGVHKGHQAVIAKARQIAKELSTHSAVITFDPHPLALLKPEVAFFLIYPEAIKEQCLKETGIDYLFLVEFSAALANMSGDEFIQDVLFGHYGVRHVVVGEDFAFGKHRSGNVSRLLEYAKYHGVGVTILKKEGDDKHIYSSSHIRHLLVQGHVREASAVLGRPYAVSGLLVKGEQRGRRLGFPTANFFLGPILHPLYGVYAVRAQIGDHTGWIEGVANLGVKPTFGQFDPSLEIHFFNFESENELYGHKIYVELIDFIRAERKFESVEALKNQIEQDCKNAQNALLTYNQTRSHL
ncbi:MAG: bifunctional riboflavin kinase/FAD synthetase [Alphaproteobacteria bacterium]|nr:bifunctional riboflavin kinase/FAD synthetase [Alphaproteobacteria bacterium]